MSGRGRRSAQALERNGPSSGDEDFVERLRTLERILHVHPSVEDTFSETQARMAEEFPQAGITVVRETKPEE